MVAEVTNTPWHERHSYVVGPPGTHEIVKALHVSPFLGMDQTYHLEYSAPGATLDVGFGVVGPDGPRLFARVHLERKPVNHRSLGQMVWAPGRGAPGVSFGIYRQAVALWRKGERFHPHPDTHPPTGAGPTSSHGIGVPVAQGRGGSGG